MARVTIGWELDEASGKASQQRISLGTFATKKEALEALGEYSANPYDIQKEDITLSELYQKWTEAYFPTLNGKSSERTITSAWKYCKPLHNMRAKDIRARHIKGIIDDAYIIKTSGANAGQKVMASPSTKGRIKSLFNLMLDFAVEYEIIDKNYARTFDLSTDIIKEKEAATRCHISFSEKEMEILWTNVDEVRFVDWILIQCYMGWRPQELALLKLEDVDLEKQCITGGMKTDAGRNRTVPIHHRIKNLVEKNYRVALELGSDRLLNDPDAVKGGMKITYDKYANRFDKVIHTLNLMEDHRAHDPRKTFITMAKKAGVDEYTIKRLVGHRIVDVTENVYTERDLEWLRSELEKIQ
ncbi:MAG: tyrosine-type recombinase/integrase [Lachnospiraceae bacterium]|nr:tyrosine-type recombinase/integrase [Lachnospiraceae bacterium]